MTIFLAEMDFFLFIIGNLIGRADFSSCSLSSPWSLSAFPSETSVSLVV